MAINPVNFLLNKIKRYSFKDNIWPFVIGTSSLVPNFLEAWRECNFLYSPDHSNHTPPEQADVLIIYGHINEIMLQLILDIYHRMPKHKKVMQITSQPFDPKLFPHIDWNDLDLRNYITVDICVSGTPPSKENILLGFQELYEAYHKELKKI